MHYWFPIKIKLEDGSVLECNSPSDIPKGKAFIVISVNEIGDKT